MPGNLLFKSERESANGLLGAGGDEELAVFSCGGDCLDGPGVLGKDLLDGARLDVVDEDQVIGRSGGDVGIVKREGDALDRGGESGQRRLRPIAAVGRGPDTNLIVLTRRREQIAVGAEGQVMNWRAVVLSPLLSRIGGGVPSHRAVLGRAVHGVPLRAERQAGYALRVARKE